MALWKRSRRQFLRNGGFGLLGASLGTRVGWPPQSASEPPVVEPVVVVAALGDTLIPTDGPKYPGYKRLEPQKISEQVWNNLRRLERVTPAEIQSFNHAASAAFGKTFVDLDADGRNAYLETIVKQPDKLDQSHAAAATKVFTSARRQVFTLFYRNFPYHTIERDQAGVPIPSDAEHQVIHPKKGSLETGWDIAGFRGPLSWTEEEERRTRMMKIHWHKDGAPRI
jgi:hypothetical protein